MRLLMFTSLLLLVCGWPTGAHPHIWIDGTFDFELDGSGLKSVRISWLFDEFNSAEMIGMFDGDRDGQLSASESELFRLHAFDHLRDRDYFVHASSVSGRLPIPDASDFAASASDGKLRYSFALPLKIRWTDLEGVVLAFFDPSYYTDFRTEARLQSYSFGGKGVSFGSRTVRLESQGWGTIHVPALQAGLR